MLYDTALRVHTSELQNVACHMGSHSVTCHPTQVNAPRLTSARKAGTRLTYPVVGSVGWLYAENAEMVYLPADSHPSKY